MKTLNFAFEINWPSYIKAQDSYFLSVAPSYEGNAIILTFCFTFNQSQNTSALSTGELYCDWWKEQNVVRQCNGKKADVLGLGFPNFVLFLSQEANQIGSQNYLKWSCKRSENFRREFFFSILPKNKRIFFLFVPMHLVK